MHMKCIVSVLSTSFLTLNRYIKQTSFVSEVTLSTFQAKDLPEDFDRNKLAACIRLFNERALNNIYVHKYLVSI